MSARFFIGAILSAAFTVTAAAEVTGTPYSVTYRGPAGVGGAAAAPAAPTPVPRYGYRLPPPQLARGDNNGLRLINGKSGQEISRAAYDGNLKGWLFPLPMNAPAGAAICLVLKNGAGTSLPLRDDRPGDDGYAFRNPLWEKELARVGELGELRAERARLDSQLDTERAELQRLAAEVQAAGAANGACSEAPAAAEPLRPAAALDPNEARAVAGGVCAVKWEQLFADAGRIDWPRFFADAGVAADWASRDGVRPVAAAMEITLPGTRADLRLIVDAAAKGRTFLEHADGVRLFARHQASCRGEVPRLAERAVQQWEAAKQAALQAPMRAKQQCEARVARIEQLRAAHGKAPGYRAELERRIGQLDGAGPSATESARLDRNACRDL